MHARTFQTAKGGHTAIMSTAAELRDAGLALCRQKDFAGGEAKLKEALALDPNDADTLVGLIKVRGVQKDLPGAKVFYEQALNGDQSLVKPRHAYGTLAYNNSQYGEARDVFRRLVEINQKDSEAHFALGNVYRKEENHVEAIKHYNLCIDQNPSHAAAYNNLGLSQLANDYPSEAVAAFRHAINLDNKNVKYRMNLGSTLEQVERYGEATKIWEEALTLNVTPEEQTEIINHLATVKTR
ncbi:MAG: tetratricopeptide repeat protein [bacterium]